LVAFCFCYLICGIGVGGVVDVLDIHTNQKQIYIHTHTYLSCHRTRLIFFDTIYSFHSPRLKKSSK
jgi:hypothetical protein